MEIVIFLFLISNSFTEKEHKNFRFFERWIWMKAHVGGLLGVRLNPASSPAVALVSIAGTGAFGHPRSLCRGARVIGPLRMRSSQLRRDGSSWLPGACLGAEPWVVFTPTSRQQGAVYEHACAQLADWTWNPTFQIQVGIRDAKVNANLKMKLKCHSSVQTVFHMNDIKKTGKIL